jgi:hypothetical protein
MNLVRAGTFAACALVTGVLGLAWMAIPAAAFATYSLWAGLKMRRYLSAHLLHNLAYERLTRGQVAEAEALLAQIPETAATAAGVARGVQIQRAMIALHRGDAGAAVAAATTALSASYGFFHARGHQRQQEAATLGLRALAYASLGRDAEALADADRAECIDVTTPETLARAGLARAIVVSHTEGAAGLAALFATGGVTRMTEYLTPRERTLARALRRMARSTRPHAYREPARRDDIDDGAKELASWVAKMAPRAAQFATEERASTTSLDAQVSATPEGIAAVARVRTRAERKKPARPWQVVVLLAGLAAAVTAMQVIAPPARGPRPERLLGPEVYGHWGVGVDIVAIFVLLTVTNMYRQRRAARAMTLARLDMARGQEARAQGTFERLSMSTMDGVAGFASLNLAILFERRADFARCLAACDTGLHALWRQPNMRALHSDFALPSIVATRAFALAATGQRAESDAERARLGTDFPTYPLAALAHLRIGLVAALREGDLEQAARIARTRTPDLPLSLRDDLLADLVMAIVDGASPEELERLSGEIANAPDVRVWIDAVAPGLRDQLHGRRRVQAIGEGSAAEGDSGEVAGTEARSG